MTYRNVLMTLLASFLVAGLTGCDQNSSTGISQGVVDINKVFNQSVVAKQELEHEKKVHDVLVQAQQDANIKYAHLPAEEQKKAKAADLEMLNQQWIQEKRDARIASLKAIIKAVDSYRQEKKIALIFDRSQVTTFDSAADISGEIIDRLKAQSVVYNDLPTVTVKQNEKEVQNKSVTNKASGNENTAKK